MAAPTAYFHTAFRITLSMPPIQETTGGQRDVKAVLEALLQAGLAPDQFWQKFLQFGCETLESDAGVLWVIPPNADSLIPQGICGKTEYRQLVMRRDTSQVSHVLQAAATDESVLYCADPAKKNSVMAGRTFLAVPVHAQGKLHRVLEFIQPTDQPSELFDGFRQQLESLIGQAESGTTTAPAQSPVDNGQFWTEFEEFSYNLHRSLVLKEVGDVAANDGRQLLQCDRMSVATLRGNKTKLLSVSDQEQVNRRSEEVRSLQHLAKEAIAVGEIIEYRSDQAEIAPHLREALSHHIELAGVTLVLAVPLFAASHRRPGTEEDRRAEPVRRPVGCLLIEQFRQNQLEPARAGRVPVVADAMGSALANALAQEQTLMLPTRRVLGKGLDYFRGRTLAKTLLVLSLLTAVALSLILIPYQYRVEAEGRLMPVVQRRVFAPWDGVVASINVSNGQRVTRGEPLITIYNDELHAEVVAARNELVEKKQEFLSLQTEINDLVRQSTERRSELQLRGQKAETAVAIAGLQKRLAILEQREASLNLTAPIDGVVATFKLEEKLRDRPVTRGEHLLEVMDDHSDWALELELPEHRMGHLLRAAKSADNKPLDVEYVLATDATGTFSGRLDLSDVASRSEVGRDSEVVVRLQVRTDKEQLPFLRIGGEATAKVHCGEKSLGYVLLGDVWEFVSRYLWI